MYRGFHAAGRITYERTTSSRPAALERIIPSQTSVGQRAESAPANGRNRRKPTSPVCSAQQEKAVAHEAEGSWATRPISLKLTGPLVSQGPGRELRITHPESEPQAAGPRRSKGRRRGRAGRRNRSR